MDKYKCYPINKYMYVYIQEIHNLKDSFVINLVHENYSVYRWRTFVHADVTRHELYRTYVTARLFILVFAYKYQWPDNRENSLKLSLYCIFQRITKGDSISICFDNTFLKWPSYMFILCWYKFMINCANLYNSLIKRCVHESIMAKPYIYIHH